MEPEQLSSEKLNFSQDDDTDSMVDEKPKNIKALFAHFGESKNKNGLVITLNSFSFLNPDEPLPIKITIGYDRKTNREFLYIEPKFPNSSDRNYTSINDGCTYNSLDDTKLRAPLTGYYLGILIRYKIYIPIEIYEILQDVDYTDPYGEGGYVALAKDIGKKAYHKFQNNFSEYYDSFQSLIIGCDYSNPLNDNEDSHSSITAWNFSFQVTDALGRSQNSSSSNLLTTPVVQPYTLSPDKNRLILGESNFSFSVAFCVKHPTLAHKIVATEYIPEADLMQTHGESFQKNIAFLRSVSVTLKYEIDARNIHQQFKGHHFKYIHFNNPHDRSNYYQENRTLPPMIKKFFLSAYNLQNFGDKVFMSLPTHTVEEKQEEREGYIYQVYDAAAAAGYRFVQVKPFDATRYPRYQHTMTGSKKSAPVADQCREYIFKKIEPQVDLPRTIESKSPSEKKVFHKGKPYEDEGHILPELDANIDAKSDFSDLEDKGIEKVKTIELTNNNSIIPAQQMMSYKSALMKGTENSNNSSATRYTATFLAPKSQGVKNSSSAADLNPPTIKSTQTSPLAAQAQSNHKTIGTNFTKHNQKWFCHSK